MVSYYLKLYMIALVVFLAIDFVWLGFIARDFYKQQLGFLLADRPNWFAAGVFYILFVLGVTVFVIQPALESDSLTKAIACGALFGLVTYATYDLTNHATVKNWPWVVTVVDLAWGTFLSAAVATIGFWAGRALR